MFNELMKSVIIVFWAGEKWPYHKRLIVILPLRIEPLWYLRTVVGVCTRASFRGIVAEIGWIMVEIMRRVEAKNTRVVCMVLKCCVCFDWKKCVCFGGIYVVKVLRVKNECDACLKEVENAFE